MNAVRDPEHDDGQDTDSLEELLDSYEREAEAQIKRQARKAQLKQPVSAARAREAGLSQPLSAANKGYQLLQKLGYRDGKGLGAGGGGRAAPLPLDLKSGRSGLGVDEQRRRERQARLEQEDADRAKRARQAGEAQQRFKAHTRSEYGTRQAVRHLRGAWRAAEQLDERLAAATAAACGIPRPTQMGLTSELQGLLAQLPTLVALLDEEEAEAEARRSGGATAAAGAPPRAPPARSPAPGEAGREATPQEPDGSAGGDSGAGDDGGDGKSGQEPSSGPGPDGGEGSGSADEAGPMCASAEPPGGGSPSSEPVAAADANLQTRGSDGCSGPDAAAAAGGAAASGDADGEAPAPTLPQQLQLLLLHLRERHRYCYYCGCQYESADDLAANCPGLTEDEH